MKIGQVKKSKGKLGVLIVGICGAVSTTFIAGTMIIRKGLGVPVGSITQLATIQLSKDKKKWVSKINEVIPLADLNDIIFGGWDIVEDNVYSAACNAEVLTIEDLNKVKNELQSIKPMKAVFEQNFVKRLNGTWIKDFSNKWEAKESIRRDIQNFKTKNDLDRVVCIWCGSTEVFSKKSDTYQKLHLFQMAMKESTSEISPSMIYAYASLEENVPYINGAPNLTVDIPAMIDFSLKTKTPICGKDFKTGQTMVKTILAPMLKIRMLGLHGWFSTNILGNNDGFVLDDPGSFKTKEESKLSVIESIFNPKFYPDLYKNVYHKVRINYYPPRKDNKESWDAIDIFGWLGYSMQLKVNFLCRDSILAAPICLDLVLLIDLAKRVGFSGVQSWLSFYFKSPMCNNDTVEHDLFIQYLKLKNTLRKIIKCGLVAL
ncbi:MAG: inositol-3-phosphate synthase [Bacteroidales bacterium OttesenSCG-928-I14]|jgi:myo-inositol-1-phosphate synthase|nr:inositol-3-phosphate synthase [Bacteroidales bacterium OttesenSCG-928-I14]